MAMQRYLGDDIRDYMRMKTSPHNVPPEYPLEHRSSRESHGSMHDTSTSGLSLKNSGVSGGLNSGVNGALSLPDEKLYPIDSRMRTSFSGVTNKNNGPRAIEEYISPRTGRYLSYLFVGSMCIYFLWVFLCVLN